MESPPTPLFPFGTERQKIAYLCHFTSFQPLNRDSRSALIVNRKFTVKRGFHKDISINTWGTHHPLPPPPFSFSCAYAYFDCHSFYKQKWERHKHKHKSVSRFVRHLAKHPGELVWRIPSRNVFFRACVCPYSYLVSVLTCLSVCLWFCLSENQVLFSGDPKHPGLPMS